MKKTMEDFREELEHSFRKVKVGDIILGTILAIEDDAVYLDLKYYAPGIIPIAELSENPNFQPNEAYSIGDEVKGMIIQMDDGNGNIKLSLKESNAILAWTTLKELEQNKETVQVKIQSAVNSGVVAYLEGIRGFIPASQLDVSYVEDLEEWVGKTVEAVVITVDEEKQKLVLSAKEVAKQKQEEAMNSKKAHLVPGSILEGTVESIMPYGAFIHLGDGLSGLLHISQISQKRLKSPAEVLTVGEKILVKLLDIKDGKLSLSRKELEEAEIAKAESMEAFDYKNEEEATTSLGDIFKKLGLS